MTKANFTLRVPIFSFCCLLNVELVNQDRAKGVIDERMRFILTRMHEGHEGGGRHDFLKSSISGRTSPTLPFRHPQPDNSISFDTSHQQHTGIRHPQ